MTHPFFRIHSDEIHVHLHKRQDVVEVGARKLHNHIATIEHVSSVVDVEWAVILVNVVGLRTCNTWHAMRSFSITAPSVQVPGSHDGWEMKMAVEQHEINAEDAYTQCWSYCTIPSK